MFPGNYHLQTVQQFHCHVQLKGPFFNRGLRPGGMVQVKGLKGDAVGDAQFIESVWQTSSLRFFTSRIQARRLFSTKIEVNMSWTLAIVEGDFWLSTIVWVKSEIAWSVMAEALRLNGEKGVGTPKDSLDWRDPKNRVVCKRTKPLFRLKYQKTGFQVKLVECHWSYLWRVRDYYYYY